MNDRPVKIGAFLLWLISVEAFAAGPNPGLDALGAGKKAAATAPKELARFDNLPGWVSSVAFSPDDRILAIGLKDQVQLVDVDSKTVVRTIDLKSGQVRSISFSPDGKSIATGSYQKALLLDSTTGTIIRDLKGHRGFVTSVAFSPDGKRLATACEDELGRIWNLEDQAASPLLLKGHNDPVNGIAWSADGTSVATAAGDEIRPTRAGQVRIWDSMTGTTKNQFELHEKAATGVAFTPNGHYLLSSSIDERVNVYDLTANKPLGFFGGHSRPTNAVIVHPDGETAISISGGRAVGKNELIAWEIATGETVLGVEGHSAKITSVAVSHNGRTIATGSQDKSVAIWNVSSLAVGIPESNSSETSATQSSVTASEIQPVVAAEPAIADVKPKELRAGIIGLDTSHAPAFAKTLNAKSPPPEVAGVRIVAAYPQGSPDIKSSVERVPKYTEDLKGMGVEIVDSIDDLLKKVDVVFLETNDGRPHYEQLLPCLKAGKPTFIDKPIAGSLVDSIAIFEAAKKYNVPVFSSSSLRFGSETQAVRAGSLGKVSRCETSSPASLEPTHPDLFWYGIHGVESLFTVMGTGCKQVVRRKTDDGKIEVTGQWDGDRVGIYREGSGYTGKAVGEKGESVVGDYKGYDPLVFAIVKFFQTGKPPVSPEETLEIYAFMEAADESKRQNGAPVTLESVMAKAREAAMKKVADLK